VLLTLETEVENDQARAFYARHGFVELGRRVMRKQLS
jgi:ribosomal protein S18 acetylase RimI-like enzyme